MSVLKPTQVFWLSKLRRRNNPPKGTRQNNAVTSEKRMLNMYDIKSQKQIVADCLSKT